MTITEIVGNSLTNWEPILASIHIFGILANSLYAQVETDIENEKVGKNNLNKLHILNVIMNLYYWF